MKIKHLSLALALGALALTAPSCKKATSQAEQPVVPPTPPTPSNPIDAVLGTWNVTSSQTTPATIAVDGTPVQIIDHIFKLSYFGSIGTPTRVVIEKDKATFYGAQQGAQVVFPINEAGMLTMRSYPVGRPVLKDGKLQLTVSLPQIAQGGLLGALRRPADPNAPKLTEDQQKELQTQIKLFEALIAAKQDLTITVDAAK